MAPHAQIWRARSTLHPDSGYAKVRIRKFASVGILIAGMERILPERGTR